MKNFIYIFILTISITLPVNSDNLILDNVSNSYFGKNLIDFIIIQHESTNDNMKIKTYLEKLLSTTEKEADALDRKLKNIEDQCEKKLSDLSNLQFEKSNVDLKRKQNIKLKSLEFQKKFIQELKNIQLYLEKRKKFSESQINEFIKTKNQLEQFKIYKQIVSALIEKVSIPTYDIDETINDLNKIKTNDILIPILMNLISAVKSNKYKLDENSIVKILKKIKHFINNKISTIENLVDQESIVSANLNIKLQLEINDILKNIDELDKRIKSYQNELERLDSLFISHQDDLARLNSLVEIFKNKCKDEIEMLHSLQISRKQNISSIKTLVDFTKFNFQDMINYFKNKSDENEEEDEDEDEDEDDDFD